jgi:hypothetical protein
LEIIIATKEHINLLVDLNEGVQEIHIKLFPEIFHETNREELYQLFLTWFSEDNFRCYIALRWKNKMR